MMKVWILAAIVAVVASFPSNHTEDDKSFQLYRGQSRFALSLLKALKKSAPRDNLFFSPHSTYRALLLAYMGARGETKNSLKKHLFLDWASDRTDITDAYKTETVARVERFSCKSIQFNSVDKIYVTKAAQLKSHITDVFTSKQLEVVDFSEPEARRTEINAFVENVTESYIESLLPPGSIQSSTNAVLANAAFFKGFWKTKFDKTEWKHFNGESSTPVEMMHVRGKFNVGVLDGESARFLEIPYESQDRSISMFIFLPISNSPCAVNELIKKFTVSTIHDAFTTANERVVDIDVQLPKMSLKGEYILNNVFEQMGMTELFDENADFGDFAENMSLNFDDIIHKAVIEVDEEGTVAAAATAAPSVLSMPAEPINFHADHPFVFMINDHITEEVLFTGIYRGPTDYE